MTPGEGILFVDAPTLLGQRGCHQHQARHLAHFRPMEPMPPLAKLEIGVQLCRSLSKTCRCLDVRTCVCPVHLISVHVCYCSGIRFEGPSYPDVHYRRPPRPDVLSFSAHRLILTSPYPLAKDSGPYGHLESLELINLSMVGMHPI